MTLFVEIHEKNIRCRGMNEQNMYIRISPHPDSSIEQFNFQMYID